MPGTEHPTDRKTDRNGTGNVVQLRPRQWLEPDDELVPFGGAEQATPDDSVVAADAEDATVAAAAADQGHASSWLGPGEHTVPITPTLRAASDFWGEDAADLQHAVEAPPAPADSEPAEQAHSPVRRRVPRPRASVPTILPRRGVLAAFAVAAAVAVALLIGSLGSSPRHSPRAPTVQAAATTHPTSAKTSHASSSASDRAKRVVSRVHHASARRGARLHAAAVSKHVFTGHHGHRTTVREATAHTADATPASTPPPARTQSTSVASYGSAGPSGTTSLIGAGTSPSG